MTRGWLVATITVALGGCGGGTAIVVSRAPAPTVGATPANTSPEGAMAGFLGAAAAQDNDKVGSWLATSTDTSDLDQLLQVYQTFGTDSRGGVFWRVNALRITGVHSVDASHAQVTLSGDIEWCLGDSAADPAATCAAITGVSGAAHTYMAVATDGAWRVDVDVDASSQVEHNSAGQQTAAPTASPT